MRSKYGIKAPEPKAEEPAPAPAAKAAPPAKGKDGGKCVVS